MKSKYTAKHKLNQAHFNGALVVSGLVGLVSESFAVFFLSLAICIALAVHSGGIRG